MIKYSRENLELARANRKQRNLTRQEGILWHSYLKKTKVHFYRQYRVGSYILDFYCPKQNLCIEIDGGQHYEDAAMIYDQRRSDFLKANGISVMRFTNTDIEKNLCGVVEEIRIRIGE